MMFTDKELDELDARFKSAMEDKFDAYNEELNARQKEIERLECQLAISRGKHTNAIAEIERLRAALEQIKYECARCKYIAREALHEAP